MLLRFSWFKCLIKEQNTVCRDSGAAKQAINLSRLRCSLISDVIPTRATKALSSVLADVNSVLEPICSAPASGAMTDATRHHSTISLH